MSSLAGDYFYEIYQVHKCKQTEINISGTPELEFVNLVQQKPLSLLRKPKKDDFQNICVFI
jgi:hypothetical protein